VPEALTQCIELVVSGHATVPASCALHPSVVDECCAVYPSGSTLTHVRQLLATKLAPILGDAQSAPPYTWAPPEEYVASPAVHALLQRADSAPADQVASLHSKVLKATDGGDCGELLCACTVLLHREASAAGTSALLEALLGTARPGTRGEALPIDAWKICLDGLLQASLHLKRVPGPSLRAHLLNPMVETAALRHWWTQLGATIQLTVQYSPAIDALLRRAGRANSQTAMETSLLFHDERRRKRSRCLAPIGLALTDARALVHKSVLYLPAVLPLLRSSAEARTLLQTTALASATLSTTETLVTPLLRASRASPPCPSAAAALTLLRSTNAGSTYCLSSACADDVGASDLALCAESSQMIGWFYLPVDAPLPVLADRAELLVSLLDEWTLRVRSCEVGPAADARTELLARVRALLPEALDKCHGRRSEHPKVDQTLGVLRAICSQPERGTDY
jgi:hypothetical protein